MTDPTEREQLEREHRIQFEMPADSLGFDLATSGAGGLRDGSPDSGFPGSNLRQLNASLKEIADQLREDRLARGPRSDPGPSSIPT